MTTLPTGSTISYSGIIAAGATLPVALTGTMFYLTVATSPLFIRPVGQSPWSQFQAGTGTETPAQFTLLELYNGNAVPVTFQVVAGYAPYIDHRQLPNLEVTNIIVQTLPTGVVNFGAELPDLSGNMVKDPNGNSYLAVARVSVTLQLLLVTANPNPSLILFCATNPLNLAPLITISAGASIAPPTVVSVSGDLSYVAKEVNAVIYFSVFEIYQAVSPGFAGIPPS